MSLKLDLHHHYPAGVPPALVEYLRRMEDRLHAAIDTAFGGVAADILDIKARLEALEHRVAPPKCPFLPPFHDPGIALGGDLHFQHERTPS